MKTPSFRISWRTVGGTSKDLPETKSLNQQQVIDIQRKQHWSNCLKDFIYQQQQQQQTQKTLAAHILRKETATSTTQLKKSTKLQQLSKWLLDNYNNDNTLLGSDEPSVSYFENQTTGIVLQLQQQMAAFEEPWLILVNNALDAFKTNSCTLFELWLLTGLQYWHLAQRDNIHANTFFHMIVNTLCLVCMRHYIMERDIDGSLVLFLHDYVNMAVTILFLAARTLAGLYYDMNTQRLLSRKMMCKDKDFVDPWVSLLSDESASKPFYTLCRNIIHRMLQTTPAHEQERLFPVRFYSDGETFIQSIINNNPQLMPASLGQIRIHPKLALGVYQLV